MLESFTTFPIKALFLNKDTYHSLTIIKNKTTTKPTKTEREIHYSSQSTTIQSI